MITILHPGMMTTVQDRGRFGFQRFGVPVCGAMDPAALAMGNLLVGNEADEAALEITGIGPTVRFDQANIFTLSGAVFSARLNGEAIECNRAYLAQTGDELECGPAEKGFRGYLCFSGGLEIPKIMESRSTCLSAHFGGYHGRKLEKGDRIAFHNPQLWLKALPRRMAEADSWDRPVRVVLGPQEGCFSSEGIKAFFSFEYRMGTLSDRMGCRLEGEAISLKQGFSPNIISDGVAMGSIQVPDGQPIVMMADRQTTGGYVKLGTVITVDLPVMAQKRPGELVRFRQVTVREAQQALMEQRRKLRNLRQALDDEGEW